jgi:hypothetical protein
MMLKTKADQFSGPTARRVVSMTPADPGTAFSEDFNHQNTLSSRRSKFNVFGADEYLRGSGIETERSQAETLGNQSIEISWS